MENLVKSKILEQIGLKDKNQWILYDENARKFFEFLAENLDDDCSNILSLEEYELIENLRASGEYLENEPLEEALKQLESEFPGILTVTSEELQELETEAELLVQENNQRDDRIARMEDTISKQHKDIEEGKKRQFEVDYQIKMLTQDCFEKAEKLQQLQKSNVQNTSQLNQIYTQSQNPPELIYQMPLDQHYSNCEQILGKIELFMRKNFNVTNTTDKIFPELEVNEEVAELKKRIISLTKKKCDEDLALAGMKNIVSNIDKYRNCERHSVRATIDELDLNNKNMQIQLDVMEKEVAMLAEQAAEQNLMKIFDEFLKEKNQTAKKRLDTVMSVQDILENVSLLCELLWVVMQLDLDRLKNRVDNKADVSIQAQECSKRIRQMKTSAIQNPRDSFHQFLLKKFQRLMNDIKTDELSTIDGCLQEYARYNEETREMIKASLTKENFKNDYLEEVESQKNMLQKFVFSGPTKRPVLYDSKYRMEVHARKQNGIELEKKFNTIRADYNKNIVEQLSSDRFFMMEKNLWIYFLTEPKKVLDCLKEVQKKASQKGGASYKALNITVAK